MTENHTVHCDGCHDQSLYDLKEEVAYEQGDLARITQVFDEAGVPYAESVWVSRKMISLEADDVTINLNFNKSGGFASLEKEE